MKLGSFYEGLEISREDKIIIAKFLKPHVVLSTCRAAGGLRRDINYLFNHQACEPHGHHAGLPASAYENPEIYRDYIASRAGLPGPECATLGTAANMHNAALVKESFRRHTVVALATGGVESNAGRVGDPAALYEEEGLHLNLDQDAPPGHGTINIMVFFSQELDPGALTRSIVTITEAKTSVLQELGAPSRYSSGLATGTGTDQVAVACLRDTGPPLTGAGKHTKLGELLGRAVRRAVFETLAAQNQLTPRGQGSAWVHLERFGLGREQLCRRVAARLEEGLAQLWQDNFGEQDRDAPTVAAVAALAHLKDKLDWGVLPQTCVPEIFGAYGAQIAAAISGRYELFSRFRQELAPAAPGLDLAALEELAVGALALGFREKWAFPAEEPPEA
ncbi:MAG: adenosylcobinamide amidohydrolase [Deltaproteobacteria bacterium]|nr:adenosylcobinamide amidohydrolase [Deltaproteobacteria bacterium]